MVQGKARAWLAESEAYAYGISGKQFEVPHGADKIGELNWYWIENIHVHRG
jgi:hypothetical protein